jgi:hypothetical protein
MEKHKVSVGSILLGLNLTVVIFFFSLFVVSIFRNFHTEEVLALFQTGHALESLVGKVQDLIELIVFILPYLSTVVAIKLKKQLGYTLASASCFAWCFLPIYYFIVHGSQISIAPLDTIIEYLQGGIMFFFIPAASGVYCAIACAKSVFKQQHAERC